MDLQQTREDQHNCVCVCLCTMDFQFFLLSALETPMGTFHRKRDGIKLTQKIK